MRTFKERLTDRNKWPRRWWYPATVKSDLTPEEWKRQHDQVSKTINRVLLVLVGSCLFCFLAIATPDSSIFLRDSKITVPWANAEASFTALLGLLPLVLIGISLYLQVFVEYWWKLGRMDGVQPLPFLFNLDSWPARWLSAFFFYWFVPVVLAALYGRAIPFAESVWMTSDFDYLRPELAITTTALVWLQIRRCPDNYRLTRNTALWIILGFIVIAVLVPAERGATPSRQLGFVGSDFSGRYLRGARLRQADLRWANLRGADLSRADLRMANLRWADLREADLEKALLGEADLSGATLRKANLAVADLRHARLAGANLAEVNLFAADLQDADLQDANLWTSDLRRTLLSGADLSRAYLGSTHLEGVDLSMVAGLIQEQVNDACLDQHTKLPSHLKAPEVRPRYCDEDEKGQ